MHRKTKSPKKIEFRPVAAAERSIAAKPTDYPHNECIALQLFLKNMKGIAPVFAITNELPYAMWFVIYCSNCYAPISIKK